MTIVMTSEEWEARTAAQRRHERMLRERLLRRTRRHPYAIEDGGRDGVASTIDQVRADEAQFDLAG